MSVYVYAITRTSHPLDVDKAEGVGDPPGEVRVIRGDSLCAVVSEAPDDLSMARRDLQAHHGVQERLLAGGPTLPLSFGFVAADEDAVRGVLEERGELFSQRLDELAGRVEFNIKGVAEEDTLLRAVLEESAEVRELSERTREGGTYEDRLALGQVVAQELNNRQDALAEEVLAALRPLAAGENVAPPSQQYFVNASFLVEGDRSEEFARAGQELAERYGEGVELRVRGPLPPYSFV
jgi:hypothetical protein